MNRSAYVGLALIATLLLVTPAQAQQAKSKAEYDAYKAMYDEQEPQRKARLAEAFLNDYGDSDFIPAAFQLLTNAYVSARNWRKVVETAEQFAQQARDAAPTQKTYVYQRAMAAAEQMRNSAKVIEYGEKVLEVDRNNLGTLLTLSRIITDNLPADESAREASLGRAFQLASRARVQAQQVLQSKPENLTDAQWDAQRTSVFAAIYMSWATSTTIDETTKELRTSTKPSCNTAHGIPEPSCNSAFRTNTELQQDPSYYAKQSKRKARPAPARRRNKP